MDESSGRAMARNLNIRITGTLGVLLKAKRDGQIPSLKFEMDRLVQDEHPGQTIRRSGRIRS